MSQQFLPPGNKYTGSFTEDTEGDGVRLNAFNHEDVDVAFDPLSANRRFSGTADLAVLGTLVFAGPTRETISVMVPDCLMPPENDTVRVDLRHHVGLSLGPAVDMTNWSPEENLERALCPGSLADTLGLQRREYWEELNPILKRWKSVNKSSCPSEVYSDQHGSSYSTKAHHLHVFLEVSGRELLVVVHGGAERQRSYRRNSQVQGGRRNLIL